MWRRPVFRRRAAGHGRGGIFISLLLGLGLALCVINAVNARLRPVMVALSTTQASNAITETVNRAVGETLGENGLAYSDMITLEKDEAGRITALTSNTSRMNQVQTTLTDAVLKALDGVEIAELDFPIGNLLGLEIFSGYGPSIGVRLVAVSAGSTSFQNEFTAAGINQTLHRILLNVTADVSILLPGETVQKTVSTQICLAETVIVGIVPESYFTAERGALKTEP